MEHAIYYIVYSKTYGIFGGQFWSLDKPSRAPDNSIVSTVTTDGIYTHGSDLVEGLFQYKDLSWIWDCHYKVIKVVNVITVHPGAIEFELQVKNRQWNGSLVKHVSLFVSPLGRWCYLISSYWEYTYSTFTKGAHIFSFMEIAVIEKFGHSKGEWKIRYKITIL